MDSKVDALERRADDFDRWRNKVDVKLAVNEEQGKQITERLEKMDKKQDKLIAEVQRERLDSKDTKVRLTMIYSGCLILLGTLLHSVAGKLSAVLMGGGK